MSSANASTQRTLTGRRVAGGVQSRTRIGWLLGMDGPESGCVVTAVGWIEDHVELVIQAHGESTHLSIETRLAGRPSYLTTPHLSLWFHGTRVPAAVDQAIRRHATARLGTFTLEHLAEELGTDPELGRQGLSLPAHDDYDSPTRGHLHSWGGAEVYADFFASAEMVRHQLDSLDLFLRTTCIQHSDPECMCVAPVHAAPVVSLVNFPWVDRHIRFDHRGEPEPFAQEPSDSNTPAVWTTALSEKDVLLGNPDKLERVLSRAVAAPAGGLILFSNTCVPVVTGEDVESVVARHRGASTVPLLYLTVTSQSMNDVLKDVLVRRRLEAEASMPPPDPQAVNLIGFPKSWGTVELCEILGQAGVRVNEILIPSLDPEKVVRLPRAALNVIWPNALWQHLYDQLQAESRTPAITPPAPFGLDGTLRWLQTVGEAVGRGPAVRQAAHDRADALVERFDALRRKASQERLCFVVRSSQHELLTEPARSWGVPLLETVESMGFAVDVFIHVRGRAGAKETAQAIHRLFRHPERHVIRAFETYGQMQSRLSDSPARAVFTQHTFDWRVTSANKAPFSVQHFEHGLMGAVLTLERLLGLCRVEFYHRLGRYLGRTPDGRRSPPWETLPRNPGDGREGLP